MPRTALLAGATGLVGAALLRQLLDDADYHRVVVLSRRALEPRHPRLEVIESNLEDLDALSAQLAADDVYCCLGTTTTKAGGRAGLERVDYQLVVGLARAAHAAGAKQFIVVSAAGASDRSPSFYSRVKARMEQAIGEIGYTAVHIVRPSLLLGARSEVRPVEALAQRFAPLLAPFCIGPLRQYRPITADDVATAMRQLAATPAVGVHIHALPL